MGHSSLRGQRVVITGGSSGIGFACAKAAIEHGASVVLAARDRQRLAQAAESLGQSAEFHPLDVSSEGDVSAFFSRIGAFDHLLTSAAGNVVGTVREMSVETAKQFYETKFWGQYICAKHAAPYVRAGGSITLFSGAGSRKVFPGFAAVGSSEGAIETLSKYLAHEFAPIRVNAVVPGVIDTPLKSTIPNHEAIFAAVAAALPVKRVGTPEDVAHACVFLMENGFTTGAVVDVNGGNEVI